MRISTWVRSSIFAALVLAISACGDDPSPPAAGSEGPEWAAELPSVSPPAIGSAVWAAVPATGGSVRLGAFRVAAVGDGWADLVDALGNSFEKVPGALMRVRGDRAVAPGDAVLAELPGIGLVVARATAEKAVVRLGWNGRTSDAAASEVESLAAEPPPKSFRPVAYRDEVGWQRGLLLAAGDKLCLVHTPDGRVVSLEAGAARDLQLGGELEAGSRVMAFRWADGFRPGVIEAVEEAGLRFLVALEPGADGGPSTTAAFAFADLVLRPVPWDEAG